jgi:hypothetical protein
LILIALGRKHRFIGHAWSGFTPRNHRHKSIAAAIASFILVRLVLVKCQYAHGFESSSPAWRRWSVFATSSYGPLVSRFLPSLYLGVDEDEGYKTFFDALHSIIPEYLCLQQVCHVPCRHCSLRWSLTITSRGVVRINL